MINRVGHVGITVTDLDRSIRHAEQIMGLRLVERDGNTAYLTCNDRHHELVLTEGPEVGCDHLAFETFDPTAIATLRETLATEGLPVLDDAPLERGVADAVRFVAPGGFVIEVFHGMETDQPAHYDTVGARPRKFEHITVKSSRKDELEDVLIRILGLRVSDRAEDATSWLRVSDEHHGVSVIRADVDQLQHYAWQLDVFGELATVADRLMHRDRTLLWGPGHHGIGDNYFCYFFDEDGVIVEYSAAIQRIEDERTHRARVWPDEPISVNRWGNPEPPAGFLAGGTPLVSVAVTTPVGS
jgi:catechol 2,3-dioxygenase-like lactoylglutathione lyase family enzyme